MEIRRMLYSKYRNDGFFQFETVNGSYDNKSKTIEVCIPQDAIEMETVGKSVRFDKKHGFLRSANSLHHELGTITFWNTGEKWNAIVTTKNKKYENATVPMKGNFAKGYAISMLIG